MPHDIFISYSRRDLAAVKPIKEELEAQGFSCWMDLEGIESGAEEFTEKIATAIQESSTMLFILSKASQLSRWSLNELGSCLPLYFHLRYSQLSPLSVPFVERRLRLFCYGWDVERF